MAMMRPATLASGTFGSAMIRRTRSSVTTWAMAASMSAHRPSSCSASASLKTASA
jgi:hypothetical protein